MSSNEKSDDSDGNSDDGDGRAQDDASTGAKYLQKSRKAFAENHRSLAWLAQVLSSTAVSVSFQNLYCEVDCVRRSSEFLT